MSTGSVANTLSQDPQRILIVTGPTAVGKSALAQRLALELKTEIISMDSVQVYREFDIGSAKPKLAILEQVKHHLIDICQPTEQYDAGRFVTDADNIIGNLSSSGRVPLLVGGTTMYLTALLHGLITTPRADINLRREINSLSNAEIRAQLSKIAPTSHARISPNDRFRLQRALEVSLSSSESVDSLRAKHSYRSVRYNALVLVLCLPRSELHARIALRAEAMLNAGLIGEVESLLIKWGDNLAPLRSIGYAQVVENLLAKVSPNSPSDLLEPIIVATRQYAKRQMTYFRNEPQKRGWRVSPSLPNCSVNEPHPTKRPKPAADFCTLGLEFSDLLSRIRSWHDSSPGGIEAWYIAPQ